MEKSVEANLKLQGVNPFFSESGEVNQSVTLNKADLPIDFLPASIASKMFKKIEPSKKDEDALGTTPPSSFMLENLPATLLGLLASNDGDVTQAWLNSNVQKLQSAIRYMNSELQFRLIGFAPTTILLALLLEEESEVRKRHFEWCCKHPSSRTSRKTIHLKEVVNDWLEEYQRRLIFFGTEKNPITKSPKITEEFIEKTDREVKE